MYWDVVEVQPEAGYRLFVRFADGLKRHVELRERELTGVLAPLRDPAFFGKAYIEVGAVTWPGDIDLAPDAMHAELRRGTPG